MDAKSRANFINSVASGEGVPCPECSTMNKPDSKFCVACGTKLVKAAAQESAPVFSQINETKVEQTKSTYEEPESVFAHGLPSWSIEPPQVMVRRHK
ncbi:MAG: zinc ribbon domain-containing protein [Clostridia bacterium]|nr:zinc ribbon domain-containing protein [Clostridia bacterium]